MKAPGLTKTKLTSVPTLTSHSLPLLADPKGRRSCEPQGSDFWKTLPVLKVRADQPHEHIGLFLRLNLVTANFLVGAGKLKDLRQGQTQSVRSGTACLFVRREFVLDAAAFLSRAPRISHLSLFFETVYQLQDCVI